LQNPSQTNGGNLSNVRHNTRISARNKKREYVKEKIHLLEQTVIIQRRRKISETYGGINEFKKG
jgi:hypothetical protein